MERMRYRAVRSPLRRGASMIKDSNRFSSFFAFFRAFSKIGISTKFIDLFSRFGTSTLNWTEDRRVDMLELFTIERYNISN